MHLRVYVIKQCCSNCGSRHFSVPFQILKCAVFFVVPFKHIKTFPLKRQLKQEIMKIVSRKIF